MPLQNQAGRSQTAGYQEPDDKTSPRVECIDLGNSHDTSYQSADTDHVGTDLPPKLIPMAISMTAAVPNRMTTSQNGNNIRNRKKAQATIEAT